jgi:sigma-54 dependent transcriptional regulator, acetoin dehydrogenase operon transcriptional activator AcoR
VERLMTLTKTLQPKPLREVRLAREKLHLEGLVPSGVLRA